MIWLDSAFMLPLCCAPSARRRPLNVPRVRSTETSHSVHAGLGPRPFTLHSAAIPPSQEGQRRRGQGSSQTHVHAWTRNFYQPSLSLKPRTDGSSVIPRWTWPSGHRAGSWLTWTTNSTGPEPLLIGARQGNCRRTRARPLPPTC